jgi:hypothetical protein
MEKNRPKAKIGMGKDRKMGILLGVNIKVAYNKIIL